MIKNYFLILAFCLFSSVDAQIINFPDINFKSRLLAEDKAVASDLLGNNILIDTNRDGQIDVIEANNPKIKRLYLLNANISSIEGIEFFKNLEFIDCSHNSISALNVNSLPLLKDFSCGNNLLTSLDFNNVSNLESLSCEMNKITSINLNGCTNLRSLWVHENFLTDLILNGLSKLTSVLANHNKIKKIEFDDAEMLWNLDLADNLLESLDISKVVSLAGLNCSRNKLKNLNVTGLSKLGGFYCSDNQLTTLNLDGLVSLHSLQCDNNLLNLLDLNSSKELYTLDCRSNNLTSLLIKNGSIEGNIYISGNLNLKFICFDDDQFSQIQNLVYISNVPNCVFNSYCSFNPGGDFYTINGNQKYDSDKNGCDISDTKLPNLNFNISNGTLKGNIISDESGNYSVPVGEGTHTITPILENPNYYEVSPESFAVTFPTETSPFTQNFCVTPKGDHQDVEITLLSTLPARPGFDAGYKIIYRNKGNKTVSGSVTLDFNDVVLDYVSAIPNITNQSANKLVWDYVDLKTFETREISVTLNVNSPMETPAVNINDRLSFNALITPVTGDEKPVDNSFALRQIVVGSYDPNDKTCLEGDVITPQLIGEYVHYLIRFENTGTYPAENIVVKDLIDLSKFDINTLVPIKASHPYVTKISEGNKVEFIFEKINLPFNDADNDGYISFKIKTLPTLKVGDSFENEANIYFDYNFPILTNKATSTFKTLGTQDFEFSNYFNIYPNPAKETLNITTKNSIEVKSIAIYDVLGQLVIAVPNAENVSKVDVSNLRIGNYILKVKTDNGTSSVKFIKK